MTPELESIISAYEARDSQALSAEVGNSMANEAEPGDVFGAIVTEAGTSLDIAGEISIESLSTIAEEIYSASTWVDGLNAQSYERALNALFHDPTALEGTEEVTAATIFAVILGWAKTREESKSVMHTQIEVLLPGDTEEFRQRFAKDADSVVTAVVRYLDTAPVVLVSEGPQSAPETTGSTAFLSDGRWVWTDSAAAAVRREQLCVPVVFAEHVLDVIRPPAVLSEEQIQAAVRSVTSNSRAVNHEDEH